MLFDFQGQSVGLITIKLVYDQSYMSEPEETVQMAVLKTGVCSDVGTKGCWLDCFRFIEFEIFCFLFLYK